MEIFIELVDTGKPFPAFKKILGLRVKEHVAAHLKKINLYRELVRLAAEIKSLSPNSQERKKNFQAIINLRKELKDTIDRWDQ